MKHLIVHGINIRAESCSIFDCKKTEPMQSSSQCFPAQEPASTCPPHEPSSKTTDEDSGVMTEAPTEALHCTFSLTMGSKDQSNGLPEHAVILDVRTRRNSLFLMVERFLEQFPAIQAASMDPQLKKSMEKDILQRVSDEDFRKAEQFVKVTKILYTSTICVCSERCPTLGQILPILNKLQHHFTVNDEDTSFTKTIKDTIWNDLSKRYQDGNIRQFLEEGTALHPRFKSKVAYEVWTRLEEEFMRRTSEQVLIVIGKTWRLGHGEGLQEKELVPFTNFLDMWFGQWKGLVTSALVAFIMVIGVLVLWGCCIIPCAMGLTEKLIETALTEKLNYQQSANVWGLRRQVAQV
ncbi:hypothetical protein QTP86_005848 [Hemibagrus guttatus]|nr:hypothetical protein QTP86_005848 [Hemibagrus guttatus]